MKDELEQVNQAVDAGAGSSDSSGDDACWMMDSYTRTVRMQKVFLNN